MRLACPPACLPMVHASVRCRSPFSAFLFLPCLPALCPAVRCCSSALFAAPLFLLLFLCLTHTWTYTHTHTWVSSSCWAAAIAACSSACSLLTPCVLLVVVFRRIFVSVSWPNVRALPLPPSLCVCVCVCVLVYCVYATQKCIEKTKTKIFEGSG